MYLNHLLCMLLVAGMDAYAHGPDKVILTVITRGNVPPPTLQAAIGVAFGIVRGAGIPIVWQPQGRRKDYAETVEVVDALIIDHAPREVNPGALAFSFPYSKSGVRIVVYYDRVATLTAMPVDILLGYTLAHELGHVLMGTDAHSDIGLMKAHWTGRDYSAMQGYLLRFKKSDKELMRRNLSNDRRRQSPLEESVAEGALR